MAQSEPRVPSAEIPNRSHLLIPRTLVGRDFPQTVWTNESREIHRLNVIWIVFIAEKVLFSFRVKVNFGEFVLGLGSLPVNGSEKFSFTWHADTYS